MVAHACNPSTLGGRVPKAEKSKIKVLADSVSGSPDGHGTSGLQLLQHVLRVYDGPDRMTMDWENSFPKQGVRPGGSSTKLMHVAVTESLSVFNQRALVGTLLLAKSPRQTCRPLDDNNIIKMD
ncbi:hypothetical protein AAY473_006604 [Plecturocebus cupreus]